MADERAFTYHGGALEVARRFAPEAPEPWVDLSTGINPHAYPLPDPSSRRGRGCPKMGPSQSSKLLRRGVTARPLQA